MGNHKFRLSDMIPNAWFYKLRDMGKTTKNQYTTTTNSITNHHPKKKKKQHQPPPPPPQMASSPSHLSSSSATTIRMLPIPQPQQSNPTNTTDQSHQRKSYYFTRDLTVTPKSAEVSVSPRKSSSKQRRRKKSRASSTTNKQPSPRLVSAAVSAGCNCRTTLESVWTKPDYNSEEYPGSPLDSTSSGDVGSLLPEVDSDRDHGPMPDSFDGMVSWSNSCHCKAEDDIVIDMKAKKQNSDFAIPTSPELPLIITRKPEFKKLKKKKTMDPTEKTHMRKTSNESISVKIVKKEETLRSYKEHRTTTTTSPVRRLSTSSPGVRLRTNSPRIASKKIQEHARKSVSGYSRKSLSESFAVVKSSVDPQRDFRESMVEMILENNLKGSKDLEDLLACYLQLNSDDYHEVIIRVFKQIWFDLAELKCK